MYLVPSAPILLAPTGNQGDAYIKRGECAIVLDSPEDVFDAASEEFVGP